MALRWGASIATVVLALYAAAPCVHNAVAQVATKPSTSNSRSGSGNTAQKSYAALVYQPTTQSFAPDDASVTLVAYDTRETPSTELVRTTLIVKDGMVQVPLACTQCMVLLQAPFPYVLAFLKGSVDFSSSTRLTNSTEFKFKNSTYTYAANQESDPQVIALRLENTKATPQAYSTSFRSFTAALKGVVGSIPFSMVAAPFGIIADSLVAAGSNPGVQPSLGDGGNTTPGSGNGSPNYNDSLIGGSPPTGSTCPCDARAPDGSPGCSECGGGRLTKCVCSNYRQNSQGITTCSYTFVRCNENDNEGGGGGGAPNLPGAGGGNGGGNGNQDPNCTCEHKTCGGCSDVPCRGSCPQFQCGWSDCNT